MRRILSFLLILEALFLLISVSPYAQIHKVKISDLKEKVTDVKTLDREQIDYQLPKVTRSVFTNSPGTVIGYAWWDCQHIGGMPRMISLSSLGGIHFTWTTWNSAELQQRLVEYNYLDPAGNWLGPVGASPVGVGGGWSGVAGSLADGREVLCFHQNIPQGVPGRSPWWSALAIEKTTGGAGNFYRYDLPDSIRGCSARSYFPRAVIDSLGFIHVIMNANYRADQIYPLGYTRCHIEDTALVCEAPGINALRIEPDTQITNIPIANLISFLDSSGTISQTVVSSPVSKKVAIIYTKYTNPEHPEFSGNVYYVESTNSGQDWINAGSFQNIQKHNITNYNINDTIRASYDIAAAFDYNDNLHVLWTTPGYWEAQDSVTTDACFLWHWSKATGINLVANGWKPSKPGRYNRTISKMSIGVNPANNYLYSTWTQFDISDMSETLVVDTTYPPPPHQDTLFGHSNGEIYAAASSDGGLTWDVPRNLTNTHTPGCRAGECESDHWSSLAEVVNDTLHIQYINDKDAGSAAIYYAMAVEMEGVSTDNPVLYLKVAAWTPEIFPVLAKFSGSPIAGFKPLTVQFTDSSSGNPTSWLWDFGDGNIDTTQNPIHVYDDTGHFDVKLKVINSATTDSIIKRNYIAVFDTLKVDLSASLTHGRKPLTVSFQSIYNVMPETVTWYFGDGNTSHQSNPIHKYTQLGNYDVKLVAELFGYKDSVIKEDYIRVSDIKAEFASDKRCGSIPLEVTFFDSSTSTYPILSWKWYFGDGDSSDLINPVHQFTNTRAYDITLIVSDSVGSDTLTKKGYVTTQNSVSVDFVGVPIGGKSPLTVMFEPILTGTANQYFWGFGDGSTSSLRNPIHTYISQGKYDVKLKASLQLDGCDQADSVIKGDYVVVHDLNAQFSANSSAGIKPLTVQFTDSSTGIPDAWFWNFGDNYTSTEKNPSHQYTRAGLYNVFLRVSNSLGVDSLFKLSYILVGDSIYSNLFAEIYSNGGRRGFDLWYSFAWTNIGTIPAENCTLKLLLPSQITFYNLSPGNIKTGTYSGYSYSRDTIVIPLSTLNPSNWYGGYVTVYGNIPRTVPIGDTLVCELWLTSSTPDQNYDNNHFRHVLRVTGSIDPNDKLAYPQGEGLAKTIGPDQRLSYTIQFENKAEATAEAIYVRVLDTLDHNLDWGTLSVGTSSHPNKCNYEFNPFTGVIEWFCDSIMLPPNLNPPEGEGYFTYSVSPKKNLFNGTEIKNSAWIRFDYNDWLQAPQEGPVVRTIAYSFMRGDANGDGKWTVADAVYLVNYLFKGGPTPTPLQTGDCNCDGKVTVADVVYLINYLFRGGAPPAC